MLGRALSCAADAHLHFGHYGEAKRLLRRAIDQVLHTGDAFLCARSLTRLGTAEEAEETRSRPSPCTTRPFSSSAG